MSRNSVLFFGLSLLSAFLFTARQVEAVLGESADSIESDRHALSAARLSVAGGNGYTVHEISSDAVTVREYVSTSGVVFAISWKGRANPDLTRLLGTYADEYHQALQHNPRQRGSRHLSITTSRVTVERWGHMRSLQGRAYIPALVPSGVSIDDIR